MNRNLTSMAALGAALALSSFASAQAPAAPAAAPAAVAPQAIAAKIALVNFEQVVFATNEGQVVSANLQKKYEPREAEVEKQAADVETMKKALTPTLTDEQRATQLRAIDAKEKRLTADMDEARTEYNNELQQGQSAVAQKLAVMMKKYSQDQGFTILLDVSSQASNVLWALPSTDISQAVVDLYNKQSGVAAPPPQSPRPAGAQTPRPAGPSPRPAAKPPVK